MLSLVSLQPVSSVSVSDPRIHGHAEIRHLSKASENLCQMPLRDVASELAHDEHTGGIHSG